MTDEERLEQAMHAYASTVTPTPDWDDVEQRAEAIRRTRMRRRAGLAALGLAAAAVVAVALIPVLGRDDTTTVAVTAPSTTTTQATPTTPTTSPCSFGVTSSNPRPSRSNTSRHSVQASRSQCTSWPGGPPAGQNGPRRWT